jgi:hypothetical protein
MIRTTSPMSVLSFVLYSFVVLFSLLVLIYISAYTTPTTVNELYNTEGYSRAAILPAYNSLTRRDHDLMFTQIEISNKLNRNDVVMMIETALHITKKSA